MRRVRASLCTLTVLLLMGTTSAPAGAATRSVCRRFSPAADQTATLSDGTLNEVSGVAASRVHPPLLWVHNDSGGEAAVYAIRPDGTLVTTATIEGATNTDWEDIAVGPGPQRGVSYLFLGDIGDNASGRDHVTVYRVPEPESTIARRSRSPAPTPSRCATPTGRSTPSRCSSTRVRGDLFVIDKKYTSAVGRVFRAPKRSLVDGADVTMEEVATFTLAPDESLLTTGVAKFPGTIITGADVSPDGSTVLVRTYRRVLAFTRRRGAPLATAFDRPSCDAPQIDERQGEAVGFAADGASYFTISEGAGASVHRFAIRPPLAR